MLIKARRHYFKQPGSPSIIYDEIKAQIRHSILRSVTVAADLVKDLEEVRDYSVHLFKVIIVFLFFLSVNLQLLQLIRVTMLFFHRLLEIHFVL